MTASLKLTNTLTRRKEEFAPIDPRNVRMYACGPTVYDFAHIGNARPVIVFDLVFRLLRHLYGADHVTYVRNITDVDDKINARAARDFPGVALNEAIGRVTAQTERQFREDVRALGVLTPEDVNVAGARPRMLEPRATEHIDAMRRLIDRLVAERHAYVASDHVLFDVPSMPDYGALSRRPLDEMEAGARVDVAPYKRSPLDFVLWKPSKPGEPAWASPADIAAPGRPGWHIECSAMAWQHLGETFDIHAGGLDLIFPHHENEIAQSRCCFGRPVMANYWLHNGFLQVEGQKMSKSLGNFVTIRDLLATPVFGGARWHGRVLRLAMLSTHYRQPIDFTVDRLVEARRTLKDWIALAATAEPGPPAATPEAVLAPLCDDLNTPLMLSALHAAAKAARTGGEAARAFAGAIRFLGLWGGESADEIAGTDTASGPAAAEIDTLLAARLAARGARDWTESDRIRDELRAMGIQIKDNRDGTTTWSVAG